MIGNGQSSVVGFDGSIPLEKREMAMKGKNLGELEQLVLLAILQLKDDAYGLNVMKELEDRASRTVARGALYAVFDRLEGKGMVRSRFGDPTPGRGGRPRRYMTVTREGIAALRKARVAWNSLFEGLGEVLGVG
jgi:DNA-binding PadR family transcriptional regulator